MKLQRTLNTIYLILLALWFGSVVMSGVMAAVTFHTLKSLHITLPGFASVPVEDNFKIAGGKIMFQVFFITDMIQLFSIIIITAITGLQIFSKNIQLPRIPNLLRLAALAVLLVTVSYQIFRLAPRMNHNLQQYWELAEKGQDGSAFEKAFDNDHPIATRILIINTFAILTLLIATGSLLVPASPDNTSPDKNPPDNNPKSPKKKTILQEPALLHQRNNS